MPRRRRPREKISSRTFAPGDLWWEQQVAARILQRYSFTRSLSDKDWNALVRELVDAVCFARVGLSGLLGGKQAKPAAWTQDIFVKDVFDALATAQPRRRLSMNRYGSRSLVQR